MPLGCWTPPRLSRIHTQETADPENLTDFGELREVSAMSSEEKVLPLKEEAPKEGKEPLSKDNEPKTAKAKGGKGKSSVSQKNARAREV